MAGRDCGLCVAYLFEEDGRVSLDPSDDPIPRPKGQKPPCFACPKVSDEAKHAAMLARRPVTPADADTDLTARNAQVLDHYRRCRAVNWQVPDAADPIVQRHAAIIHDHDRAAERAERAQQVMAGLVSLSSRGAGNG